MLGLLERAIPAQDLPVVAVGTGVGKRDLGSPDSNAGAAQETPAEAETGAPAGGVVRQLEHRRIGSIRSQRVVETGLAVEEIRRIGAPRRRPDVQIDAQGVLLV